MTKRGVKMWNFAMNKTIIIKYFAEFLIAQMKHGKVFSIYGSIRWLMQKVALFSGNKYFIIFVLEISNVKKIYHIIFHLYQNP